jgi:flagellar basal-body rod protein FlgG
LRESLGRRRGAPGSESAGSSCRGRRNFPRRGAAPDPQREGDGVAREAGAARDLRGGQVKVNGKEIGRLRIESVPQGTPLAHTDGTMFIPPANATPVAPEARSIRQGFLEDSNVNTVGSLVDMISIQRSYAAVQKTITTLDDIRQTISTELGKPA